MQFTPTQKRAAAWCLIAALVVLALWLLGPVLTPFMVAAVLAYALTPLVNRLDDMGRGRLPRVVAVILVELLFILLALSLVLMIVPIVAKEIPLMREQVPLVFDKLNAGLFYLLMDWDRFVARLLELVPLPMRSAFDSFTSEADSVLGQYLRGQLLVMLIMAAFYATGLALFGLDLALPIGIFTGLAMFIPYLGFGIGLILAILAGLLQFASIKAIVMVAVVYGIGQMVESLYFTPRLVGERIGLHPLAVIFALLAFGQVFGFVGVLIALPASAVLLVAIRRIKERYITSRLYKGQ